MMRLRLTLFSLTHVIDIFAKVSKRKKNDKFERI